MELEMRIGQFTTGGQFTPGYTSENRHIIQRLLRRLEKNCQDKDNWTNDKQYMFIRAEYPNGIRRTCIPNNPDKTLLIEKKRLGKIDLNTDRNYDIRFSLCSEAVVTSDQVLSMVKINKPESVRMIQRASFIETINLQDHQHFRLQYDISKVSKQSDDKMTCTKYPCSYQCELELIEKLQPLDDKAEEEKQNKFIARVMIDRSRALLGSYTITPNGLTALNTAKLCIVRSTLPVSN
jgi:hypothetical protein